MSAGCPHTVKSLSYNETPIELLQSRERRYYCVTCGSKVMKSESWIDTIVKWPCRIFIFCTTIPVLIWHSIYMAAH